MTCACARGPRLHHDHHLLQVESNDMMAVLYLASLIRSVLALHDLIDNKGQRAFYEQERVSQLGSLGSLGGCGVARQRGWFLGAAVRRAFFWAAARGCSLAGSVFTPL